MGFMVYIRIQSRAARCTDAAAIAIILLFLGLNFPSYSFAAPLIQTARIKGKVVADIPDQRKPLSGVVVQLSGERLGTNKLQSISDEEGAYDFPSLLAGEYTVSVELTGFKKYELRVTVQIDATVEQNILLQPVPVTE